MQRVIMYPNDLRILDQLKEIKKITLGHVICAVTNIDHVQKDIFKTIDHKYII